MTHNRLFAGLLLGVTAGVFASSATAAPSSSAKKAATPYVPGEILVTFKESALASTQSMRVNSLVKGKVTKSYRRFKTQWVKLPADVSIAQAIKTYQSQSAVLSVQPNYRYHYLDTDQSKVRSEGVFTFGAEAMAKQRKKAKGVNPNDPLYKQGQWALKKISAPFAWKVETGNTGPGSVVVAVIDSGVNYQHVDLRDNMWTNSAELPGNGADDDGNGYIDDYFGLDTANGDSNPIDDDGHGTHVAGTIGAQGNNRRGIAGVNWDVQIMAIKAGNEEGLTTASLAEAIEYMIGMRERGVNVRVANHSYGGELPAGLPFDPLVKTAFDEAGESGILNAVAAGNGGFDGIGDDNAVQQNWPANYSSPSIISVAATDREDRLARFSNYGRQTVDIAAPGVDILSTYPFENRIITIPTGGTVPDGAVPIPTPVPRPDRTPAPPQYRITVYSNTNYKELSGTSMAAPHVAGAAGLLFAFLGDRVADDLDGVEEVKRYILNGADKLPQLKNRLETGDLDPNDPSGNTTINGGRLNVALAIALAGGDTGIPVPTPTPGPTPDPNATPTPIPTATPVPTSPPLPNGDVFYTEFNVGFFYTINRVPTAGGASAIFVGDDRRRKQNPYVSLKSGFVAYTVNLANVTDAFGSVVDVYGVAGTFSFPENEIFVRSTTTGTDIRVTDDEANGIAPRDDREPAISPDGRRIVWVRRNTAGNDDIYIANTLQDPTQPRRAPQMFKLVGDNGGRVSTERRPSWTPDGTKIVFQSNRPVTPGGALKDYDIYMVNVPAIATQANTPLAESALVRLTNNPGDDVEPTVGPTIAESVVARPNGQLAYASNRDDSSNDQFRTYFRNIGGNPGVVTEDFGEDYDIYLQDLSLENNTTNRSIRIVDTPREANEVLGGTGDTSPHRIDPNDPANADDDYFVEFEIQGDDRRPTFSADGKQVIFATDSNFFFPYPGDATAGVRDDNPNSDYDIVKVDIDSRGFMYITQDTPSRAYRGNTGPAIDDGTISGISEDFEPSAGAAAGTGTNPPGTNPTPPPGGPPTGQAQFFWPDRSRVNRTQVNRPRVVKPSRPRFR